MTLQTFEMPTDDTLRSKLPYGTKAFPFEYYLDEIRSYNVGFIDWHWHYEFEFSIVKTGTVECRVGAERLRLDTGDGIFLNSGTIHSFATEDNGTLADVIFAPEFVARDDTAISCKFVQPILNSDCAYTIFHRNNKKHREILDCINDVFEAAGQSSPLRELRVEIQTITLWERFLTNMPEKGNTDHTKGSRLIQARTWKMLEYIRNHYSEAISLKDIAAAANISTSEALRCFRVSTSMTPVYYLNKYRLSKAHEELLVTSDSVAAVAAAAGFGSAGYFCRVFRKEFGCSPNALRK